MRVSVDRDVCQNYGQCVFSAPAVFDLDDDDELVYDASPDDSHRDDVDAAVGACPVQAISADEG